MYLTRSEYDRGVNTFSPEGRLFQVRFFFLLPFALKQPVLVSILFMS